MDRSSLIEPQLRWFYRSIHLICGHRIELGPEHDDGGPRAGFDSWQVGPPPALPGHDPTWAAFWPAHHAAPTGRPVVKGPA